MEFEYPMIGYMVRGMWAAVILAGPPLVIATAVGLVIALLQTLIQLQEQTLPIAVKIIAVAGALLMAGPALWGPLHLLTEEIFTNFPLVVK